MAIFCFGGSRAKGLRREGFAVEPCSEKAGNQAVTELRITPIRRKLRKDMPLGPKEQGQMARLGFVVQGSEYRCEAQLVDIDQISIGFKTAFRLREHGRLGVQNNQSMPDAENEKEKTHTRTQRHQERTQGIGISDKRTDGATGRGRHHFFFHSTRSIAVNTQTTTLFCSRLLIHLALQRFRFTVTQYVVR